MRIVHLNTHSYGGAAVVARRLHRAALAAGIESRFITKYGVADDPTPNFLALKDARLLYFLRRKSADARLYRLGKLTQRLTGHRNLAGRPPGLEVFSPLNRRAQFADCTASFEPDVIHLHWIAGFLDHATFFERNRHRKFVWTLHDMNPFTGGCHHSDGCMKFTRACTACPQLAGTVDPDYANQVLSSKAQYLSGLTDDQLIIVAPSRWILELSTASRVTSRFRHRYIGNPTLQADEPGPAAGDHRRSLGLPADKKLVLFVSDNLRNPRKGMDLLLAAVRQLSRKDEVHLVGLGQPTDAPTDLPISFAGAVRDERRLAWYYESADVVVNPAVAENASLVMIEATSRGTPVVAFATGGTPELIDESAGSLARERTPEALAAALQSVLFERSFSRREMRARAARFAPAAVLSEYLAVYHELTSQSAA